MMKRILCAWFPNWPIQRLRAERPELNGRPLVLWVDVPGRGQRVTACSDEAAACGVRLHAPLANIASLGRRMARQGHCELHHPAADLAALQKLAAACERFSPTIGLECVEKNDAPSCLLMNVTGLVHLFHSEERLAEQFLAECQHRHYAPRVAVADTLGAAWAAARFAFDVGGRGSCRAKQAASLSAHASRQEPPPPSPFLIIPPSQWEIFHPLPVDALRLSPGTLHLLEQLGIMQIKQLLQLPRASLAARFGDEVARRIDQLFGAADESIVPHCPSPQLTVRWALEHPVEQAEVLQHVLSQLFERLADQLVGQGIGAVELICRLRGENGWSIELPVYLFEPTAQLPRLMNLVELQWQRRSLPGPITDIAVDITATAPLAQWQYKLFTGRRDNPCELAALVNQLSNRLGREQVARPQLRPDAQPEKAFRYVSLAGVAGKKARLLRSRSRKTSGEAGTLASSNAMGQRPLRLLTPPQEIEVVAVQPEGGPALFTYQQQRHQIVRYWGPERIQTGWWRGRSIQRDYYRVETIAAARYWLFRRLTDRQWFLHGEFE